MTVGSTAGLPPQRFFTYTTQLLGSTYPSFDARWPNDSQAISVQESVNNFTDYTWRFWSSMAPVQMYNHDGGSFDNGTETERQQAITQISAFLNARGVRHVFMEDLGAYMCARTTSVLSAAQASSSTLTLNFTGDATDMDGNLVPTNFYIFYGDNEGLQQTVPGFSGGFTFTTPNAAPPSIGLGTTSLVLSALPGASPVTQTVPVNNTGSGTLTYTAHASASWLSATVGTGKAPDTLTISADPGQRRPESTTAPFRFLRPERSIARKRSRLPSPFKDPRCCCRRRASVSRDFREPRTLLRRMCSFQIWEPVP